MKEGSSKGRVYWKDEELIKLYPEWHRRKLEGVYAATALDEAQRAVLLEERWRSINQAAVSQVRDKGGLLYEGSRRQEAAAQALPAQVEPDAEPPPPEPIQQPPRMSARDCIVQLLADAARQALADPDFQDIALSIGKRFLIEALAPPKPKPAQPEATQAPRSAAPKLKQAVVIVGPDSKQVGILEQEFKHALNISFFDASSSKDAIRNATKNAVYAISTLPHPNGPVDVILRTNIEDRDNYKHINGQSHLRDYLRRLSNGMHA